MVMEDPNWNSLPLAATPANSNDCVFIIPIDLFHGYLYPQNLSRKWQSKTMLHHCIKSDSLLGFVVRVHDRFRDECIKMGLISTKIFAGGFRSELRFVESRIWISGVLHQSAWREHFR